MWRAKSGVCRENSEFARTFVRWAANIYGDAINDGPSRDGIMTHRFPNFYRDASQGPAHPAGEHRPQLRQPVERPATSPMGETEAEPEVVDVATLQLIKEAANRQWRQIQDMGIETSHLMNLAGAIWEVLKFGSESEPLEDVDYDVEDVPCDSFRLMTNGIALTDEISEICMQAAAECPSSCGPEGTIKLGKSGKRETSGSDSIVVSLAAFFDFSFEVTEALNHMVENHQQN